MQFATNHLGHFALATGLHDALAAAGGARVVSVSSSAHHRSPVVFDDIHFERRPYEPWSAYGQSKTANVLFAVEASKRWAERRHHRQRADARRHPHQPAAVRDRRGARPAARRGRGSDLRSGRRPSRAPPRRSWSRPRRCSTASAAATSRTATRPRSAQLSARNGVAAYALDPEAAARLWQVSLDMLADRSR